MSDADNSGGGGGGGGGGAPAAEGGPPPGEMVDQDGTPEMTEQQAAQAAAVLNGAREVILPTHKPRDALYGIKSGIYSIGAGTMAGAAALVTAPVVGARSDGWRGFASGLGVGLASAVALPVAGVVNGGRQIVRGCANTFEAIDARTNNKVWDSTTQQWKDFVPYSLPDEAAEVLSDGASAEGGAEDGQGPRPARNVADDKLYQLLKVPTDATTGEIKKAYYKEARRCHPDRNPNDPDAHQKFQALGEAYRTLSSDQLRAHYDKHGADEEDKTSGMDAEMQMEMAKMFFAVMFGGERFESYIGTLGVTSVVDALVTEATGGQAGSGQGVSALDFDEMKKSQTKREVQCALELVQRLEPFVSGDEEGFRAWVSQETAELSRATFGEPLLHAIGAAYVNSAQAYIGFEKSLLGVEGYFAQIKQKTRQYGAYVDVAKKGYDSINAVKEMAEIVDEAKRAPAAEALEPPTAEALIAKRMSYEQLSVKELRNLCGEREPEVDLTGCLEKDDIVTRVMLDDEKRFEARAAAAAAGELPPSEDISPEAAQKMQDTMEASLPTFLSTMVSASLLDVEVTTKAACTKVTADTSVPGDARLRRAYALLIIGEAFKQAVGATPSARGEVEAKHVFEGTMMKTMAKAQGQEVHYDDEFIQVRGPEDMEQEPEFEPAAAPTEPAPTADAKDGPPSAGP